MGHSDTYVHRRQAVIDDLRQAVATPTDDDPEYRHDQAIRAIEQGFYALMELSPHMVDAHRIAGLAGDLRELALTAHETRRRMA